MPSDIPSFSWDDAVREFLMHIEASRATKTVRYYKIQLGQLVNGPLSGRKRWTDGSKSANGPWRNMSI